MIYNSNQESIENAALHKAIEEAGEDMPCSNYPDAYFVDPNDHDYTAIGIAISLCQGCPIRKQCAEYGIRWEPTFGVWGGLRPNERRKERTRRIQLGIEVPNLRIENASQTREFKGRRSNADTDFDTED